MKEIAAVLWGDDHYEDTLYEMVDYMINYEELSKEEIVGMQVEFCEEANVYSKQDIKNIEDIIYAEERIYEDEYFAEKRTEIMKLIESVKYYSPFQKYIITEKDYEEVNKDL